jgi:hypothetical protein
MGADFVAHVVVPDQTAIEQAVLARRKQALLDLLTGGGGASSEPPAEVHLSEVRRLPPSW